MNTPTHFLMTAVLRKTLPERLEIPRSAALLGSVAPDLPLFGLSFGGIWYFSQQPGWSRHDAARHVFGNLYFNDPLWIGLHNLFHSPLSLLLMLGTTWLIRERLPAFARWCHWFLLACLFHSAIDIPTHFDDGPLLFWPVDWTTRFQSPVSYWDPAHYGRPFFVFEVALVVALCVFLLVGWIRKRGLAESVRQ